MYTFVLIQSSLESTLTITYSIVFLYNWFLERDSIYAIARYMLSPIRLSVWIKIIQHMKSSVILC